MFALEFLTAARAGCGKTAVMNPLPDGGKHRINDGQNDIIISRSCLPTCMHSACRAVKTINEAELFEMNVTNTHGHR